MLLGYHKKGGSFMGQITIYLDTETEKKMHKMIKKKGVSKSRWIAELIREKTSNTWPESIIKLSGAWKDFPNAEDIRKNLGSDVSREPI
jgi:hypothetical protein